MEKFSFLPILAGLLCANAVITQDTIQAQPSQKSKIANLVASESSTTQPLTLRAAKLLLGLGSASNLQQRPALWDWGSPSFQQPVISQALPVPNSTPATDLLDEVTVTATRRPTRQGDTTVNTYSIGKKDFDSVGALTATDALKLVPGFEGLPAFGGAKALGGINLRGFNDLRFLVLRDGVSLQRSSDSSSELTRYPLSDIERIEVLTGGAGIRYGSGAIGGVINLITETPKGSPKLTLAYEAGTYGLSRYIAKYGGGDDTFSYNLTYTGIAAFNNYPFSLTIPNQAQFYGVNDFSPVYGSLAGLLKPTVGPPITLNGRADSVGNASDTYTGKLTFRPSPYDKVTLRVAQENSKSDAAPPGQYSFPVCRGGANLGGNGTISGSRFLPVDALGNEQACNNQAFLFNTPTTVFARRYPYFSSFDGSLLFPSGQAYLGAESVTGSISFFQQLLQTNSELYLRWERQFSPELSLNSFVSYYNYRNSVEQPNPFLYNTNVLGFGSPGSIGKLSIPVSLEYVEGTKIESESLLNASLPGNALQFGINFTQDRIFARTNSITGINFLDQSVSRTSVFLLDDIKLDEKFRANLGFRYTYSTQFGSVGTPAVGLRYNLFNWLSLRANGSYVFNAPPLFSLFSTGSPFLPNPDLKPESGVTYEIGFDLFPSQNLGFQFTYFNTYVDGYIGTVSVANPDPLTAGVSPLVLQQQNLDTKRASGIELSTRWQLNKELQLKIAWTNTDARFVGRSDSQDQPTYPFYYEYQDPLIPFNKVVFGFSYASFGGWKAALTGIYDGGKRRAALVTAGGTQGSNQFVPAFFTIDFTAEIPVTPSFTLTGAILNLTDTQYEYASGLPAPGTTFRVGARLELGS